MVVSCLLLNKSIEDGGAIACRRVLLGTLLAACRSNAAEDGDLDVVSGDLFQSTWF